MDAQFYDGASRWGIKGSNEVSDGLTAVYRFETGIDTDANQGGPGRLNYVGLSGSFGNLTLGRIWSASYNHAGVIRDFPNWHTSGDTSGRVGNAVSYAFSNDTASFQIDAVMDGSKDTGQAIDQLEFGLTVNLGDIGKLALGYTSVEDYMEPQDKMFVKGSPTMVEVEKGMANSPTMVEVDPGMASVPTVISVKPGTKGEPVELKFSGGQKGVPVELKFSGGQKGTPVELVVTGGSGGKAAEIEVTGGAQGEPVELMIQNAIAAVNPTPAQYQFSFEGIGDAVVNVGDVMSGSRVDGEDVAPSLPADLSDLMDEYESAVMSHYGIFTPTGRGAAGTRGSFEIIDEFGETKKVSTFIEFDGSGTGAKVDEDALTGVVTANQEIVIGSGDSQVTIPVGAVLSSNWRMARLAYDSISSFNQDAENLLTANEVEGYDPGSEAIDFSVSIKEGTGTVTTLPTVAIKEGTGIPNDAVSVTIKEGTGTVTEPLVVEIVEGTGTVTEPLVVEIVEGTGTVTTPTEVTTVTNGVASKPTEVEVDPGMANTPTMVEVTPGTVSDLVPQPDKTIWGKKATHVSLQLNLGALTGALGHSQTESNNPAHMQDAKTTFAGVSGSIGDTGMNWGAWVREKEDHMGKETNPWTVGLNKALGDGAKAYIEHGNRDGVKPNSTVVGLVVNF